MFSTNNLPSAVVNKSLEQKEIFIKTANAALQRGRTEQEAILSGLSAIANSKPTLKSFKRPPVESDYRPPSHVPTRVQEEPVEAIKPPDRHIKKAFLPENSLESGIDRNLVSADFNSNNQLVLTFDNGESIKTKAIATEEYVENYVSVVQKKEAGEIPGLLSYVNLLSGLTVTIPQSTHALSNILSLYFTKNGKAVNIGWEFTPSKTIIINSGVDLTGVLLTVYGN